MIIFVCLIIIFLILLSILILLYENHEKYSILKDIGNNNIESVVYTPEKKPYPKGGLKYNKNTDYSHFKQRRAISQNRTDGQDS